jgi:hypothetical protein
MGKLILRNNGKETQLVNGQDFTSITPEAGKYVLGFDAVTGNLDSLDPLGNIIQYGEGGTFTGGTVSGATTFTNGLTANTITVDTISATTYLNISAGGLTNTDYSGLTSLISTSGLTAGSYYLITDFQTCYDQPDFDYDGNPITSGNYKQGPVEPLIVFATSVNTISSEAHQPTYPNDKITYDWSFSATEVTNSAAFGRITERIDEFNNRTDYDHRNILFKRYRLFTIRQQQPLNGTIELQSDGTVLGTNTYFTNLSVGDVIFMDNNGRFHEIINITDNTTMTVSGDTIFSFGCCGNFWMGIEETNGGGYFSYNQRNVKTDDYLEYTTFGDAISNDYVKNTYIGNYANNYQNVGFGTFLLANNVFLEGQYESNKFGDYCYNNTFGTDNQNNTWGDYCYQNVSTNDIDDCTFGYYFNNNLINSNMESSKVGNQFANNKILGENSTNFRNNIIGDNFNNNTIYSDFYENDILYRFEDNIIGDFGNLDNFEFYRNYINNDFRNNTIRQTFQNNKVGTNYQNNQINGESVGNTILNGFNNNQTGYNFRVNNIGNAFNNNIVNDNFFYNSTDYYFYNNKISNDFIFNDIQTYFQNNAPENQTLFGWSDLYTVSTRTYDVFNDIVGGGQLGNKLLGKEFVMRVISTSQYFKIKFTQWTQNGNGGGFQYTREEIDSSGNPIGPQLLFTKRNYSNDTDIIVPGVVEITRGNDNGIYNSVSEGGWSSSVSPSDTEWNSIYTEPNSGERFGYNKIGNLFQSNIIGSDFGYGFGNPYGNIINDNFEDNVIGQFMYNNVIGNEFKNNEIGNNFENNQIKNYFINNGIGDNFESNIIGDYFGNLQSGPGSPVQNVISNEFKYNRIGDYFGNNLNYPTDGAGSGGDGGNIIASDFQNNVIGNNTIMNIFGTGFTGNKIGDYLSLNSFGDTAQDNVIGNYFTGNGGIGGYPNQIGNDFTSNKIGNYAVYNQIDEFRFNEIGNLFGNSNTNEGNIIYNAYNNKIGERFGYSFGNTIYSDFFDNLIGNNFYNNVVGDFSRNNSFYRNDIGNDFRENIVYSEFQNNEIGNQFNNNICGDEFKKNTIGNGFNNNKLSYFDTNKIGDGANYNVINDGFNNNIIGGYFSNNRMSDANSNNIGPNFSNNRFGSGFGFYDTSDVTSRNYDNFRDALAGNIGNYIIGRELIMLDTVNNEYYSFVFTKWTQGGNGGGFKYTRQLVYPSFGPTVEFERPDYSASTIDVIIPGVLEIKRDDNGGGIYNVAVEGSFNGLVSPTNTTWNSYFTTSNNGSNFVRNRIGNEFYGNEIIGSNFSLNDISNLFRYNENIGNDFIKNTIKSEVLSIDFSTATYVYSNYNCEVFENSSNNNRLSYYDGSDVLNIVNITD